MTMASHWPAGTASIAVWSAARRFSAEPSCRPMSRCRNVMMVLASAASSSSSRWKTGQAMTCNRSRFIKLFRVKLPVKFADEFRRSAAATADEVRPGSENSGNVARELRRRHRIDRLAIVHFWQAGVGFNPDRMTSRRRFQSRTDSHKSGDALAAIRADDIRASGDERGGGLFRRSAHHGAVFVFSRIKNHAGHDWQAGGFRGGDGDARLVQILHGFHDETLRTAAGERLRLLGKGGEQ